MEAAELAFAEKADRVINKIASISEMRQSGNRIVPLEQQARAAAERISDQAEFAWVRGYVLRTDETVYAPYELVGLDFSQVSPWNISDFYMSSLGMGAGFSLEAAVIHGIQEIIEDDALFGALRKVSGQKKSNAARGMTVHAGSPLAGLMERVTSKGAKPLFHVLQSQTGLPVVAALLDGAERLPIVNAQCWGTACRHSIEAAALAALLEAIQVMQRFRMFLAQTDTIGGCQFGFRLYAEILGQRCFIGKLLVSLQAIDLVFHGPQNPTILQPNPFFRRSECQRDDDGIPIALWQSS